jgi:hypothetical protein
MRGAFIAAMLLCLLAMNASAYDVAIFPAKQGYTGWNLTCYIEIYNNLTEDVTFEVKVTNPVKHTKYNESGIFDTTTTGEDLKEYEDFPDFSWIQVPEKITVKAKSSYKLPVKVDIPETKKYAGKRYEALITITPENNDTIKIALASRLLINTPAIQRMPSFSPSLLLLSLPISLYLKKERGG